VAFRKHVLPVFRRPRPGFVGCGLSIVFCSGFRDVFSLLSSLFLGMKLYIFVALPPDWRCLGVWKKTGGGVGLGADSSSSCWTGSSCIMVRSSCCPDSKVGQLFGLSWGIPPWFGACFSFSVVFFFMSCGLFRGGEGTSSNCGVSSCSTLSVIVPL